MADISTIEAQVAKDEEIADIPIYQKNGDPYLAADGSPATIGVTGTDAKRYVAMQATIQRRMLNQRRAKLEPADIQRNRIDQASSGVGRWHGWENGDQPLDATPENVKGLLRVSHILDQVEAGIAAHSDFFRASGT